jgi:valyl-tRNA synthetase
VARRVLAYVLDQTLRLLHPFVPYVSEHLFQCLAEQVPDRSLTGLAPLAPSTLLLAAAWPKPVAAFDDEALCATFRDLQAATSAVREVRATQQVPAARKLVVTVKPPAERAADLAHAVHVVAHLAGASEIRVDAAATLPRGAAQAVVGDLALFVHDVIDPAKERERLSRERDKLAKEVSSAEARLANPSFVDRAPAPVVAEMRERLAGYREQLAAVEGALSAL